MPDSPPALDLHDHLVGGSESLLEKIAAAMYHTPTSFTNAPVVLSPSGDAGSMILQLTEAVAEAKNEADKERSLRMILELENEVMRHKQMLLGNMSCSGGVITTGHPVYSDYSRSTTAGTGRGGDSKLDQFLDQSLSMSECLTLFSSMPPHMQDALYMSYFESGWSETEPSQVQKIFQPYDYLSISFVLLNVSALGAAVSANLLSYNLQNLESLMGMAPLDNSLYPIEESDEPRMNLLHALNVKPGDDISHIVTVRKCHKLGFKSNIHLKQYFSRFGKVERVVLLPMRSKQPNKGNRPSSMGFIVFESAEVVPRVLETPVHTVKGWPIEVRNFVKPADKPLDDEYGW